jgi:hypothetical protein
MLDYRYIEPSGLEAIRANQTVGPRLLPITRSEAIRQRHNAGAWLGREGFAVALNELLNPREIGILKV